MAKVSDADLRAIVDAIVMEADPEHIYLFGSQARGGAGAGADVDLLIVEREPFDGKRSRRHEMARLWRLLARFKVPKDILAYSLDEVDRWRNARKHVVAYALREGRLLYERP